MKVGLYTFGGPKIGTGHLFRCLALARWLDRMSEPAEIQFEVIDLDPNGPAAARSIVGSRTGHPCRIHQDPELGGGHWDVLVVDRLRVPPQAMQSLRRRTRYMVSIDDVGPGRFFADAALNPLYRSCEPRFPGSPLSFDRQGPEFQIIGPEFSDSPSRWREDATDVLITQGGADPHGIAPRIIRDLEPLLSIHDRLVLHVLTGPAFRADEALRKIEARLGPRLVRHKDVTDMAVFLRGMDLAVSAVGVTPFELAALGLPSLLVTGELKEVETADELVSMGSAVSLGIYREGAGEKLRSTVDMLLRNPSRRAALREAGLNRLDGRMGGHLVRMIEMKFAQIKRQGPFSSNSR
jgi:UDP-2,4-diacetamido-2,4,6-trideoxy-beta-L-altropyranose hydrolase